MAQNESKEIQPFRAEDLRAKIETRIKASFLELIPDEAFSAMIAETLQKFTEPRTTNDAYNPKTLPSEFEVIVREVYRERLRDVVAKELQGEEWAGHWDGNKVVVGEQVKKIILENSSAILLSMIGTATAEMIGGLEMRIRDGQF